MTTSDNASDLRRELATGCAIETLPVLGSDDRRFRAIKFHGILSLSHGMALRLVACDAQMPRTLVEFKRRKGEQRGHHPHLKHRRPSVSPGGHRRIIQRQPDMLLVAEASTGNEGIQKYREHHPDIVLMDLRLPDMTGIDALIAIRTEFPQARIIMVTTFEGDVEINRALEAGAFGYILKVCLLKS